MQGNKGCNEDQAFSLKSIVVTHIELILFIKFLIQPLLVATVWVHLWPQCSRAVVRHPRRVTMRCVPVPARFCQTDTNFAQQCTRNSPYAETHPHRHIWGSVRIVSYSAFFSQATSRLLETRASTEERASSRPGVLHVVLVQIGKQHVLSVHDIVVEVQT